MVCPEGPISDSLGHTIRGGSGDNDTHEPDGYNPPPNTEHTSDSETPEQLTRPRHEQVRTVQLDRAEMVVEKDAWVAVKGELGRAKSELVRLDAHVALLNKCNDRLERECEELKATVTTLRMKNKDRGRTTSALDNTSSVFRVGRYRRQMGYNSEELHGMFKEEGVQLTFHPCFVEVYMRMFHLAKHTTSETTWESLFCDTLSDQTDMHSINKTIVTDWRGFMVEADDPPSEVTDNTEPLWHCLVVAERKVGNVKCYYIPECLYSRHKTGPFYATAAQVLNRALYEFTFIRMRTSYTGQESIGLSTVKEEVGKSNELQRRLRATSQAHIANRRKEAKDVYFGILGYDVATYTKHWQDLQNLKTPPRQRASLDSDDNDHDEEEGEGQEQSESLPNCSSQDDNSSLLEMEREVEHLLNVFAEDEALANDSTNRWRVRSYETLCSRSATDLPDYDDIQTDILFRNKAARVAYDTFIGTRPSDGQTTSLIWVARADAWMTCVIEDLRRRLKGVSRGGREPHVLKTRYIALLPNATANLQRECLRALRRSLSYDDATLQRLHGELQVRDGVGRDHMLNNDGRKFTIAIYYRPNKLYYIAIKPKVFAINITPHLGHVMDAYVGYCTNKNRKMTPFDSTVLSNLGDEEDAISDN